jgi:hypothetical protein
LADTEDNIPEFAALLDDLANSLDLTRDGLGADMLGAIAEGITDRTLSDQKTADGQQFEPNRGTYGKRKREKGLPVGVGLEKGGEMVSLVQVKGTPTIEPDSASMVYGISDAAKEKALWFETGSEGPDGQRSGASNQPAREFYAMDDAIIDAVVQRAEEAIVRFLEGLD